MIFGAREGRMKARSWCNSVEGEQCRTLHLVVGYERSSRVAKIRSELEMSSERAPRSSFSPSAPQTAAMISVTDIEVSRSDSSASLRLSTSV